MVFLVTYSQLLCGDRASSRSGSPDEIGIFFFVPLAFVTSAFGMNVKELQENFPSIFVFVVAAVVTSLATYMLQCLVHNMGLVEDNVGESGLNICKWRHPSKWPDLRLSPSISLFPSGFSSGSIAVDG